MANMVRAKFQCSSMRKYASTVWSTEGARPEPGFLFEYEFYPVTGKDGENAQFFASTPAGSLKMSSVRENQFVPGKPYYLDFTLAE